jgi:DNA-binding IclR family transcriptional regulator
VSGPVYRLTEDRAREIAPAVVAAAASVSERMGYQG